MTPSRPAALALALRSALDPTITPDQWLLAFELLDEVLAKARWEEDISTRAAQGRLLRWLSKALGPWAEFYPQADLQALIDDMVRGTSPGNSPTLDLRLLALLNPSTYFGLIDHHGWRGELNSEVSTSSLWTVLLRHSVAGSTAFSENPSGIISSSAFVEFERFSMEMTRRASVSCSTDDPAYERQLDTGYIRLDPERIAWLAEQHGPSGWFAESLVASDRIEQSPDLLNESFVRVFQGSDIDLLARLADVVKNDWREALRLIPDEYGKFAPALDGVPSHDPAQGQILNELAAYKRLARSRASGNRYDMIQAARAAAAEVHLLALQVLSQDQLEAMARTLPLMRTYAELLSGPYDSLYNRLL